MTVETPGAGVLDVETVTGVGPEELQQAKIQSNESMKVYKGR